MTMANSWSYVPNDVYKPTDELIEKLVDVVSKGGNFLLNIGPSPQGTFDDSAYNRLKGIGDWMKINSEAIYNSRKYTSFSDGDTIRYTQSKDGKTLYVFLFNKPGSRVDLTKTGYQKNMKATLLGSKTRLKLEKNTQGLSITIPGNGTDQLKNVWVIKLSRE